MFKFLSIMDSHSQMFTDVTIGELCTVTQLTHTPQLGPGPGHSQWN